VLGQFFGFGLGRRGSPERGKRKGL
jgi:hypothetical protein